MGFGTATRLLAEELGVEMTPDQIETMVRGWIGKCREHAPELADKSDAEVFDELMTAIRRRTKEQ